MLQLTKNGVFVREVPVNSAMQYGEGLWLSPTHSGWKDGEWALTPVQTPVAAPTYPLEPLSRVQFRKMLRNNGYSIQAIADMIEALPDSDQKEDFLLYWNDSYDYDANNPITMAAAKHLLNMPQAVMEEKWRIHLYGKGYNDV